MALRYRINRHCSGCGLCSEACVVDAVVEEEGLPFRIAEGKCVLCGECFRVCPVAAVEQVQAEPSSAGSQPEQPVAA